MFPPADGNGLEQHQTVEDVFVINTTQRTLDLRPIYASGKSRTAQHHKMDSRSISSITTDLSTTTTKASNTTQRNEQRHHQKRRFLQFTRVLMRFLERKAPAVYQSAQAVLEDCEQQERRGETSSNVMENLKGPLKGVVPRSLWQQARDVSRRRTVSNIPPHEDSSSSSSLDDGYVGLNVENGLLSDISLPSFSCRPQSLGGHIQKEEVRRRKKRKWMIISVLMRYLQSIDVDLYQKAKASIADCLYRHRNQEEGYHSLSGSIQSSLKREVGTRHWRRAEGYVAKLLVRQEGQTVNGTNSIENLNATVTVTMGPVAPFERKKRAAPNDEWESKRQRLLHHHGTHSY